MRRVPWESVHRTGEHTKAGHWVLVSVEDISGGQIWEVLPCTANAVFAGLG